MKNIAFCQVRHFCGLRDIATLALLAWLVLTALPGSAQEEASHPRWAVGLEYLEPTMEDRPLDTINLDLFYAPLKPNRTLGKWRTTLFLGLTATRATGTITQLVGSFAEGTLRRETFESSGNGIGPVFLLRLDALRSGRVSLSLDASHGIIFYDRDFPAGGDRYNGMRRLGISASYRLSDRYGINVGYRWMHGSNGKGVVPHNPAYEARGANLQFLVWY